MTKQVVKAELDTRPVEESAKRMWRLRGCPRCKGDIFIDRGHLGWYEYCLQCGYQHDLNVSDEAKGRVAKKYKDTLARTGLVVEVAK